MVIATKIKQSMSSNRKFPGAAVHVTAIRDLLPTWCHFLIAAGFQDMSKDKHLFRGSHYKFVFSTTNFAVVMNAFD
jgi:hypothetical protein